MVLHDPQGSLFEYTWQYYLNIDLASAEYAHSSSESANYLNYCGSSPVNIKSSRQVTSVSFIAFMQFRFVLATLCFVQAVVLWVNVAFVHCGASVHPIVAYEQT